MFFCLFSAALLAQPTDFFLPHTTQTPGEWETSLVLYNPTGARADVTITAYDSSGGEAGRLERALVPGERLDQTIAALFPALAESRGWLHIQSNITELSGVLTFSALQLGGRASLPLITTLSDGLAFAQLEHHDLRQSGLVLTNPGTEAAEVTLRIRGDSATTTTTITLAARGKWVGMLADLVPEETPTAAAVDVWSTAPITGFALTFQNNGRQIFAVPATVTSGAQRAAWQTTLNSAFDAAQVKVGVSAGYKNGDATPVIAAAGIVNRSPAEPAKADMRGEIGSITKSFTAAILLQLQEEGLVDLDLPISTYVPELLGGDSVTTRMLLNHTSGLKNYTAEPEFAEQINAQFEGAPPWQPRDIIDFAFAKGFDFEPGTAWNYSNSGYLVAGLIAEQVSGQPLLTLYRERLWQPLGMHDTFYGGLETIDPRSHAYSFSTVTGTFTDVTHVSLVWAGAAGAIISTSQDMVTWAHGLFGGAVLSEAALQEMLTVTPLSSAALPYGLGVVVGDDGGEPIYNHNGGTLGGASTFYYYPNQRAAFAMLVNCNVLDNAFAAVVQNWARGVFGIDKQASPEIDALFDQKTTLKP
ncbi:serine hydrolase domain-containing protein [Acanthopleuribacter pedis]